MPKGKQSKVNIKTDGLTRNEILTAIRMHNTACQRATAMVYVNFGDEGLEELRQGLADVEGALQEQTEVA